MEGKHTPGPWRVEDGTWIIWGDDIPIARCVNEERFWGRLVSDEEGDANAQLIASAPQLRAALQMVEWSGSGWFRQFKIHGFCPVCGGKKGQGHKQMFNGKGWEMCKIEAALKAAGVM